MKKMYSIGLMLFLIAVISLIIAQQIEVVSQQKDVVQEVQAFNPKTQELRNVLDGMKSVAVLGQSFIKFIPEKLSIKIKKTSEKEEIALEPRKIVGEIVACFYNIAEIVLSIDKVVWEAEKLKPTAACLQYNDAELKLAVSKKEKVDPVLEQCAIAHCKSKRGCVAYFSRQIAIMVNDLYSPAIARFNIGNKTVERGLLLNIDVILDSVIKSILQIPAVKNWDASKKQKVDLIFKRIDQLRFVLKDLVSPAISGIIQAFIMAAGILDQDALTDTEKAQYQTQFTEAQTEKIAVGSEADTKLDDIISGLS